MANPDALIRLLPPCLHWHPDGEIRLVGHRIGLYHFVYYYNQGFTAEMILCQFPTLELATIHKVIAFYLDHHEEVDHYVAQYQVELDHLRGAGPHAPSVTEVRTQLECVSVRRHSTPIEPDPWRCDIFLTRILRSALGGRGTSQRPAWPPARDRLRGRGDRTPSQHL